MRQRGGGAIVLIASIWGRESGGRMTYNAVKAAEISLAKALAQQLAPTEHPRQQRRARVDPVPGGSWHQRQQADPEGIAEFVSRELPFGRFGRAEEVGAVVAFLASARASWFSGCLKFIDNALACLTRSDPYTIVREIGRGGMGVVYEGWDERLSRAVAIKTILRTPDPPMRERFVREARAAAAVSHPNICQLFDIGEHQRGAVSLHGAARREVAGRAPDRRDRCRWPKRRRPSSRCCRRSQPCTVGHRPSRSEADQHLPHARTA